LEEALAISDRIIVMRDGVIEQIGTPADIYDLPRNAFVADFVGSANLIHGRRRPELDGDGLVVLETPGGALVHGVSPGRPPGAGGGPAAPTGGRRGARQCSPRAPYTSSSRASVPARGATCGPRACGAASFRATSPSTISTGTDGGSSSAASPRSRSPRERRSS